jgi:predicted phage tail protein
VTRNICWAPANVVNGNFSYSAAAAQKARHTTATVAYQTYDSLGEVEFEYVEDADAVSKYGVINKDMKAVGCYSRGQAHRLGKWALLTEQTLTETVSFSVSIESGVVMRPGMVIGIADPVKSWIAASLVASKVQHHQQITVDATVGLPTTTLPMHQPFQSCCLLVWSRRAPSAALLEAVFTVSTAFSEAPNAQSVFLIETNDIRSNLFRVISVAEGDGGAFSVTALAYNASLYAAIESDLNLAVQGHQQPICCT